LVAMLNAEIPSLERTISALQSQRDPNSALPSRSEVATSASWAAAMTPSTTFVPQRPLRTSRARGGAVNVDLTPTMADATSSDDDKFLVDSEVGGGTWHEG
jgi:hypothetical protein